MQRWEKNTQHIPATNAWHWILSRCKTDCWAHIPCSPSKKTDSSTLCLRSGRTGVQDDDKLAWEGGGAICQLAEWPWASCLRSTQLSLPTSPKRELSPPHSLPLKNWWLWLHVQHMPAIKRGCQSYKLFSRLIRPTHILFDGGKIQESRQQWTCLCFCQGNLPPMAVTLSGTMVGFLNKYPMLSYKTLSKSNWGTSRIDHLSENLQFHPVGGGMGGSQRYGK